MIFSEYMTMEELSRIFRDIRLISGGEYFSGDNLQKTIKDLHVAHLTWSCKDIIYGLNRLYEVKDIAEVAVYGTDVEDTELKKVDMIYMPAQKKTGIYAILLSGGAYGAVCNLPEAIPVAAKLNENGISCFCLNYRTAVPESFISGLMPKPLDDLAAAVRHIRSNAGEYGLDTDNCIMIGFSAGGHVVSLWGTKNLGAEKYGLPYPKKLVLAYPLVSPGQVEEPMKSFFARGLFGAEYKSEVFDMYDASKAMHEAYPPFYVVRAEDDDLIKLENADGLAEAANAFGVPNFIETGETGGHGFGLGSETSVAGWVERAISNVCIYL